MSPRRGKNRVGAAVLVAVLAMALAAPAGAAPWSGFGEARELASGFLLRALAWLAPAAPDRDILKCEQGSQIDPNGGCHKAAGATKGDGGSQIDPNGGPKATGMRAADGSRIVPGHGR